MHGAKCRLGGQIKTNAVLNCLCDHMQGASSSFRFVCIVDNEREREETDTQFWQPSPRNNPAMACQPLPGSETRAAGAAGHRRARSLAWTVDRSRCASTGWRTVDMSHQRRASHACVCVPYGRSRKPRPRLFILATGLRPLTGHCPRRHSAQTTTQRPLPEVQASRVDSPFPTAWTVLFSSPASGPAFPGPTTESCRLQPP